MAKIIELKIEMEMEAIPLQKHAVLRSLVSWSPANVSV
jgi:hypothetical protein